MYAYPEETNEVLPFQVACLRVGELCPDLLERSHLLSSDRLGTAGHLEYVVEALDDNTSEQVGEDVLQIGRVNISMTCEG